MQLVIDLSEAAEQYDRDVLPLDQLRAIGLISLIVGALDFAQFQLYTGQAYCGQFGSDDESADNDVVFVNMASRAMPDPPADDADSERAEPPSERARLSTTDGADIERVEPPSKRARLSATGTSAEVDVEAEGEHAAAGKSLELDERARSSAGDEEEDNEEDELLDYELYNENEETLFLDAAASDAGLARGSSEDSLCINAGAGNAGPARGSSHGPAPAAKSLLSEATEQNGAETHHLHLRALSRYVEAALALSRPFGHAAFSVAPGCESYAFDLCQEFINKLIARVSGVASAPSSQARDYAFVRDIKATIDVDPLDALIQYLADIGQLVERHHRKQTATQFITELMDRASVPAHERDRCSRRYSTKMRAASTFAQILVHAGSLAAAVPLILCGRTFTRNFLSSAGDGDGHLLPAMFSGRLVTPSQLQDDCIARAAAMLNQWFWRPLIGQLNDIFPFTSVSSERVQWDVPILRTMLSERPHMPISKPSRQLVHEQWPTALSLYDSRDQPDAFHVSIDWAIANNGDTKRIGRRYGQQQRPRPDVFPSSGSGPQASTRTLRVNRALHVKQEA
jgi:hypothetical protein